MIDFKIKEINHLSIYQRYRRFYLTIIVVFIGALLLLPIFGQPAMAAGTADVKLALAIETPYLKPGTDFRAQIHLSNKQPWSVRPLITLTLPEGLIPNPRALPEGSSYHLDQHMLSWSPSLAPNSKKILFISIPATVANLTQPEKQVTASISYNNETETVSQTIWLGLPPTQSEIKLPTAQIAVGQPLQLEGITVGSNPISQKWSLGDGRIIDVSDPLVVYPMTGTYKIELQLTNPLQTVLVSKEIHVVAQPRALFRVDQPTIVPNQLIPLANLSGGLPPLTYHWDFGNGQISTDRQPELSFSEPGQYKIALTVRNNLGTHTIYQTVNVTPPLITPLPIPSNLPPQIDPVINLPTIDSNNINALTSSPPQTIQQPLIPSQTGTPLAQLVWYINEARRLYNLPPLTYISGKDNLSTNTPWESIIIWQGNNNGSQKIGQLSAPAPMSVMNAVESWINNPQNNAILLNRAATEISLTDSSSNPTSIPTNQEFIPSPYGTELEQIIWFMNEARRIYQLPELTYIPSLNDHQVKLPWEHLTAWNGYTGKAAGDFSSVGLTNPIEVVEFWVDIFRYNQLILDPSVTHISLGKAQFVEPPQFTTKLIATTPADINISFTPSSTGLPVEQLVWYINETRRIYNLPPLTYLPDSVDLARKMPWQNEIAILNDTQELFGYLSAPTSNQLIPAIESWVNDPGTRPILLNPNATTLSLSAQSIPTAIQAITVNPQTVTNNTISIAPTVPQQPVALEPVLPAVVPSADGTPIAQLIWYVNEARRLHNLPPIQYVTAEADLTKERPWEQLMFWYGDTNSFAFELNAVGYPNAIKAVEFWVNNQLYHDLILNPEVTHITIENLQPFAWDNDPFDPNSSPPEQLLWYINEARRIHGLQKLSYAYESSIAAQQHSDDMALYRYTAHQGSDGSQPWERIYWYGYTGQYAGEATAWGFENPQKATEFWVNSPDHRGLILNPKATEVGVGYTVDVTAPNIWYWTVEFGINRRDN